jgi:hypothetical protein
VVAAIGLEEVLLEDARPNPVAVPRLVCMVEGSGVGKKFGVIEA